MRFVLGLLKGGLVGGLLGAGLFALYPSGPAPVPLEYLTYGLVGALAGTLCGTPPWRKGAWIGALLKGIVGVGVGVGIYTLVRSYVSFELSLPMFGTQARRLDDAYFILGPAIGIVYGLLIEADDGGTRAAEEYAKPARKKSLDDLKVD